MNREEIANKLADDGWCPESETLYLDEDKGYVITKTMFISDQDIDEYIGENDLEEAINKAEYLRDMER